MSTRYCQNSSLTTGLDLYSRLLSALTSSGKIQQSVFGSLNFDSLLEQAAVRLDCLPIISEISPRKENLFAPRTIREMRWRWQDALSRASSAAIIGVSYNQYDSHIVEGIEKLAVPIFYIGGRRNFDNWHAMNSHFEYLAETFEGGFDPLLEKI